jgi:hypothetical protein
MVQVVPLMPVGGYCQSDSPPLLPQHRVNSSQQQLERQVRHGLFTALEAFLKLISGLQSAPARHDATAPSHRQQGRRQRHLAAAVTCREPLDSLVMRRSAGYVGQETLLQTAGAAENPCVAKPLRCRLRLHNWEHRENPETHEYYQVCLRCNAYRDRGSAAPGAGAAGVTGTGIG